MNDPIRFWQWPNILALDAAIIAAAWLWIFSELQSTGVAIPVYLVLAASVWLTYMADRLFDATPREQNQLRSIRHRFAKKYAGYLWAFWTTVLLINVLVATTQLTEWQISRGLNLLLVCLLYTSLNQFLSQRFFPKELFVAIIFAAGPQVFLQEYSEWQSVLSFAVLCLANCLAIAWKEKFTDAQLRVRSLSGILAKRWFYPLIMASLCLSFLSDGLMPLATSILSLAAVHSCARHLKEESFRVLCDTALLVGPILYFLGSSVLVR